MTTAHQFQTVATLWADLTDALGDRTQHAWPPPQLRDYLTGLDQHDIAEAAALRALERSPEQLGNRPVPISLRVLDTMRTIEAVLHDTADQIAAESQRTPMPPAPASWPTADRIRRNRLANADANHPHRWHYTGKRPGAIHTALWLSARAAGTPWPGRPLTETQTAHLATVATGTLARIENALDLADHRRDLTTAHPCPCGGTIQLHGGAGAQPTARCKTCGAIWTERGVIAA